MHGLTIFPRSTTTRGITLVPLLFAAVLAFPTRAEPIAREPTCIPAAKNSSVLFHGELIAPFGLTIDANQKLVITSDHAGEWKPKARYQPARSPSPSLASLPVAVAPEFLDLAGAPNASFAARIPMGTETIPIHEHQEIAPIPEPKTLVLVSIGILLAIFWRCRRAFTATWHVAAGHR